MNARAIRFGAEARSGVLSGLTLAARAAGVAMGPMGRYVAVERDYGTPVLRDGVGVIRVIKLADAHQQIGVDLAREVAVQCSDRVGDGTTMAVILFHRLVAEGVRGIASGLDTVAFADGLRAALKAASDAVAAIARTDIDRSTMLRIATVAGNGDAALGDIVTRAIETAGEDGLMTVRVGNRFETIMTEERGYSLQSKPLSEWLSVPLRAGVRELEDAFVLVVDGEIPAFDVITPVLESILQEDQPLVVVCEGLGPLALAGLAENKRSKVIDCTAVRSTFSGIRRTDTLEDVAAFVGATMVGGTTGLGLKEAGRAILGTAGRVVFGADSTLFVAGGGDREAIDARARDLAAAIAVSAPGHERDQLRKRLAYLAGTAITVEVGGATPLEAKERRDRFDNAARAVKAALTGGYVAGGGLALLAAAEAARQATKGQQDYDAGALAVRRALRAPAEQILANAGLDASGLVARLEGRYPIGVDFRSGNECDLIGAGILDPAAVATTAIAVAGSAAETLIRMEAAIFAPL